uniref:Uncharacterized protein n=1 Tax=Saccharolobus islandicus TaxID=43080 RepID=Q5W2Y7_SACIS|nr:hypothetical protein [Sulfolobus islandicus]
MITVKNQLYINTPYTFINKLCYVFYTTFPFSSLFITFFVVIFIISIFRTHRFYAYNKGFIRLPSHFPAYLGGFDKNSCFLPLLPPHSYSQNFLGILLILEKLQYRRVLLHYEENVLLRLP